MCKVISETRKNTIIGVLFSLCGTALFTPIYAAGKFADGMIPALAIMTARYVGGFLTVSASVVLTMTPLHALRSPKPYLHVLRAMLGAGGGACTIHAATHMPVADAAAIGLTEGLIVVALAAMILREHVTLRHWLAGSLCALGAYIVLQQTTSGLEFNIRHLEGAIAAFAGAIFIAFEALLIKVLARQEHALGVLLHVNGFASLLLLIPGYWVLQRAGLGVVDLMPFLLLGPLAIAAQACNIMGYRKAEIAVLGPVNYSWILFATALGIVFFNEVPGLFTFLGGTLIVAGGVWLTRLPIQPVADTNTLVP